MSNNPAENICTVEWRSGSLRFAKNLARAAFSDVSRETRSVVSGALRRTVPRVEASDDETESTEVTERK